MTVLLPFWILSAPMLAIILLDAALSSSAGGSGTSGSPAVRDADPVASLSGPVDPGAIARLSAPVAPGAIREW